MIYEHIPGYKNVVADHLSRSIEEGKEVLENITHGEQQETAQRENPSVSSLPGIASIRKSNLPSQANIITAQQEDEGLQTRISTHKRGYEFLRKDGIWYRRNIKKDKLQLMTPEAYKSVLISYFHIQLGCHQGENKTYQRMSQYMTWPGMRPDIRQAIATCEVCKLAKPDHRPPHKLGRFPVAKRPFEQMHLDLIGPLPRGLYKNKYILSIIDSFSRFVIAKPITAKTPEKIIRVIQDQILQPYGHPSLLICDGGKEFDANRFTDFCEEKNINIHFTSPYHHSSNGLVERTNYSLENLLRCALLQYGKNWVSHVPKVVEAINTSSHPATQFTPKQIVGIPYTTGIPCQDRHIDPIQPYILEKAERHAQAYQNKTAKKTNIHRRSIQYKIGDVVYVKTPPPHQKLKPIYQGPAKLIDLAHYSAKVQFNDGIIRRVHINHLK